MSGRRHVGYVLKRFPRISETFVAAELLALRRRGEQLTVFTLCRPDEPFAHGFLADLDVRIVYLPHRPLRQPVRVATAVGAALASHPTAWSRAAARALLLPPSLRGWRRVLQASALTAELRAAGVTHVHAHFATTAARLAALAFDLGGPTYSVTAHAKDIWHHDVGADRLRAALGAARFVATVSEANRRHLEEVLEGVVPVHLVPNSVDPARLPVPSERTPEPGLVLTVARLVEKKGLDDLVRACGRLARAGRPVRLEVVGDGPQRAALEALAAAEGANVSFTGAIPHEQVADAYRRAAVFALPCVVAATGDRDGLPTAVLEAMAAGVPVVTTAVNGLADVAGDERTALVVHQRDPAALGTALARLLDDAQLSARLAEAGRRVVTEGFTVDRSAGRLQALFEEVA